MPPEGPGPVCPRLGLHLFCSPLIHLSMASLSNRQTLPIRIAGIFPSAAYLHMVISCNFRYFAISLVVIIFGMICSSIFKCDTSMNRGRRVFLTRLPGRRRLFVTYQRGKPQLDECKNKGASVPRR